MGNNNTTVAAVNNSIANINGIVTTENFFTSTKQEEKFYQVFVSSTYKDLVEERLRISKGLLKKNCMPVGMEYFPATNRNEI